MVVACGSCGTELTPSAKFCGECGTPTSAAESAAAAADAPAPQHPAKPARQEDQQGAERRQLTVMFCDIVGSTALSEKLDPEILREVVHSYHDTTGRVIGRYEGHNAQYLGDGLLVYFGYPIAHDDDAERAVRAGREIITALSEMNAKLEKDHGTTISVRVGIHTGPVVIGGVGYGGRQENLALGSTTNIAARFESVAETNTVLISEATLRLIPGLFVTEEVPMPPLKGVGTPIRGYVVRHPSGVGSNLADTIRLTPLVGRELEVGLCLDRWEMVQDGAGQALLLSGDAGIGKSRLLVVLRERLADTPHTWLECRGSYYMRQTAFQPVTELLQQAVGFQASDTDETKLERLRKGLEITGVSVSNALPLLAALLSLPLPDGSAGELTTVGSAKQRKETIAALVDWIHAVALKQPLVLIVEDLHWCDPSTIEFLGILIEQMEASRVMVVVAFRPEAKLPWPGRSNQTPVVLSPLRRSQVTTMITGVAGGRHVPDDMVEFIIDKAGGILLYVEAITEMMIESKQVNLVDGRHELIGEIDTLTIPSTLKDSLMARLDSRAEAKELAQLAAVIGREFAYRLIENLTDLDESDLRRRLAELVAAELFYQRGVIPTATFTFKHALIQDTAYQSLLRSARRGFHARIAQVLEVDFPDLVIARPEMMAHHCETGGLAEKALEYYVRAGDAAAMRSANKEAIHHFQGAVKVLKTLADSEDHNSQNLNLLLMISGCQMSALGYGHADVASTHKKIQKVYKLVDDPKLRSEALLALATFANVRAEFDQARQLSANLKKLGESLDDPWIIYMPECQLGIAAYLQGNFSASSEHTRRVEESYDRDRHLPLTRFTGYDIRALARSFDSMTVWLQGNPDRAIARGREAIDAADEVRHYESAVIARCFLAWVFLMRGEASEAMVPAEEAVHISETRELKFLEGFGRTMLGLAMAAAGNNSEGIEEYRGGCQIMFESGARFCSTGILSNGAAACLRAGDPATARSALDIAFTFRDETNERFWESEMSRLSGEICLASEAGDEAEAERLFKEGLQAAQSQGAKSFELRAAMSLARLWQKQGKQQQARDLLAPIYDWFSEGLDTGDLREADSLLKELNQNEATATASG
jgi:class 3 adenylate cyclase/tetratricopeptide (TPR) repeat protein